MRILYNNILEKGDLFAPGYSLEFMNIHLPPKVDVQMMSSSIKPKLLLHMPTLIILLKAMAGVFLWQYSHVVQCNDQGFW